MTTKHTESPPRERRHHLIVYAHPDAASFNHAVLDTAVEALTSVGDTVVVSDLYAESFSPTLEAAELDPARPLPTDVLREQRRVDAADSLIFIHPVWWFDRPAILKGWCDRVLRPGFAYASDPATGVPVGLLGHKRAGVIATFGAAEGQCELDHVLAAMTVGTLGFCGVSDVGALPLYAVPTASREGRADMLVEVREFLLSRRSDRADQLTVSH